jgi:2-C-methyl-D-erythritol 4-phosphate cytidylyltransferase
MSREFALILPAAGSSRRYGAGHNKLVAPLNGEPLIARTLRTFLRRADVAQVLLVAGDDSDVARETHPTWLELLKDARVQRIAGGETRAHSVRNAAFAVRDDIEWVAVHDAARPLISDVVIDRALAAAFEHGAAVPALPVALTIKQAHGPLPAKVIRTVPRHELYAMQTPQIVRAAHLRTAFERCPIPLQQVTDDVQLIELQGGTVCLVDGDERNLKITTRLDLRLAEVLLSGEV